MIYKRGDEYHLIMDENFQEEKMLACAYFRS